MKISKPNSHIWLAAALVIAAALALYAPALAQDEDPVSVSVHLTGHPVPGGLVTARATVEITDGSTLQSYAWRQTGGVEAILANGDTSIATLRLGFRFLYRRQLVHVLSEPPIGSDQLPHGVAFPEGQFVSGLQNRFQVVGIHPFALEEAGLVELELVVTTTSGTYTEHVEVHTELPWKPATGIRNVGLGRPVLLYGKEQGTYDWRLEAPGDSGATLMGAAGRMPEFIPDVPGLYELTVTDRESGEPLTMEVFAGTWRGVIVTQDEDGRPIAEGTCTSCHSGSFAPDVFSFWAQSGHAEIFSDNLNTSTHYGDGCFDCHTVGFDYGTSNGGFDDASDYAALMGSGLLNNPGDNWTAVLDEFPDAAKLANVQCENCHGPADSAPGLDTLAHGWRPDLVGEPRISLSSDLCATCHGEPLRHARFQQWQLSAHANYELAVDEAGSGNCARCHSANGFLAWLPVLLGEEGGDPTASVQVTWTPDEAHPQTCVTCHDPHDVGTTSGIETNARIRIEGDTPDLIAGFSVLEAGRGAICMTCHNSRRGLRNDAFFADIVGTSESARAPHGSSQTDLLMGENAYFVNVGVRGAHSLLDDTCVSCHMEETPPPDLLSYNQGGTNHTFYAKPDVCSNCHEGLNANVVQTVIDTTLNHLGNVIEDRYLDLFAEQLAFGNRIDLDGAALIDDLDDVAGIEFGESHGRQAITVTLRQGTVVGPFRLNDVNIIQPAPLPALALYEAADPELLKAGWNWNLVMNDGSRGVHNPRYALSVLDGARDALGDQGGPRAMWTMP